MEDIVGVMPKNPLYFLVLEISLVFYGVFLDQISQEAFGYVDFQGCEVCLAEERYTVLWVFSDIIISNPSIHLLNKRTNKQRKKQTKVYNFTNVPVIQSVSSDLFDEHSISIIISCAHANISWCCRSWLSHNLAFYSCHAALGFPVSSCYWWVNLPAIHRMVRRWFLYCASNRLVPENKISLSAPAWLFSTWSHKSKIHELVPLNVHLSCSSRNAVAKFLSSACLPRNYAESWRKMTERPKMLGPLNWSTSTRWWFQIVVIVNPTWGNDPIWLINIFRWVGSTTN